MPGSPDSGFSGIPGFGWFIAFFVIALLVVIGSAIARAVYRSSRGVDPFFAKEQIEAKIVNSELLKPAKSEEKPEKTIEQRLAEIDDLHARGVISDGERAEARGKILAEG
jgi:hypothetical protein